MRRNRFCGPLLDWCPRCPAPGFRDRRAGPSKLPLYRLPTSVNEPTLPVPPAVPDVTVLDIFVSAWKALLLAVGLGAGAGAGYFYMTPPQWEADVTLRVGRIAGAPIEPAAVVAERVSRDSFLEALKRALGGKAEADSAARVRLLRDSMRSVRIDGVDMVRVVFRVLDREDALRVAAALVAELRRSHDELSDPLAARLNAALADLETQIGGLESERGSLVASMTRGGGRADRLSFQEQVLAANVVVESTRELGKLRERRIKLETELSEAMTFPTHQLGGADISNRPVRPRRGASVAVGALIGLLLAASLVLLVNSRKR